MNHVDPNLSIEAYHQHPAISRSGLSELARTPKHYWWKYLSGKAEPLDTEALRVGQAFHTFVLEPKLFNERFIIWSGKTRASTAGKEEHAAAVATGKTPIKQDQFDDLKKMAEAMLIEPASKKILVADGQIEPSYFWQDGDLTLKCRPDYYRTDGIVLDVKTTADASPEAFEKSIINYYYDVQAYMTITGIEAVTGKRPEAFVFVCVEKDAPHCVAFYNASEDMLAVGQARYNKLLEIYRACKINDSWPGYGNQIRPIGVPEWFRKRMILEG